MERERERERERATEREPQRDEDGKKEDPKHDWAEKDTTIGPWRITDVEETEKARIGGIT